MAGSTAGQPGEVAATALTPATVSELQDIVKRAAEEGTPLRVMGGGTRQAFGNVGAKDAIQVSTSNLNRVIDYSPVDLTIAVEPGCTIAELNTLLAENRQVLPLDVAHPEQATIGGSFATGLSGPRRLKHGSLKDRVIGTEVVNFRGVATKSGGMVVKNVSGYELSRLHYGAIGAFGIVTRINLKVAPLPEASAGLVASFSTVGSALSAGRALAASQLEPDAVFVTGSDGGWRLHAFFSGSRRVAWRQVERALDALRADDALIAAEEVSSDSRRLEAFERFVDLTGDEAIVRVSTQPSEQQSVVDALKRAGSREVCADIGSGLVYAVGDAVPEWRDAVLKVVERPVFLALPDLLKRDIDVFGGMDGPGAEILRRLKREFDPASLFNPGRFVLGL